MICGKMASTKNSAVNITFDGRAWITGTPRDDQKKTIIAFGELTIFPGLIGLSTPGRIHYCSLLL
jgi:hypothetical protein